MLDRTVAPTFGEIEHLDLVKSQQHPLQDGRTLNYINGGPSGVLKLEVVLQSGVWYENAPGISWFTTNMLREGTQNHSAQDIADVLEYHGSFLELTPGFDSSSISILCTKSGFEESLKVLQEMLLKPVFPEPELETLKNIRSQQINVGMAKNSFAASRKIRNLLFGNEHPYGRSLETDEIPVITSKALEEYYNNTFLNAPEFFLSGDVGEAELKMVEEAFSSMTPVNIKPAVLQNQFLSPDNTHIVREESLQSSIRIAFPMPPKDHEDYFKILLTNEIMGGYFGSRLMKNLREDKGYTYGIHSRPLYLQQAAFLILSTDVTAQSTEDAVRQIELEMEILRTEVVSNDELETVKNYMSGSFLSSVSTPFELMERFKSIHFHGLDYSHYENYFARLKNISAQEVMDTANKYFSKDLLYQVIVG